MKYLCGNSYTVNKNPKHINMLRVYFTENVFSHPDFTVGSGIPIKVTGSTALAGHGLYHR